MVVSAVAIYDTVPIGAHFEPLIFIICILMSVVGSVAQRNALFIRVYQVKDQICEVIFPFWRLNILIFDFNATVP